MAMCHFVFPLAHPLVAQANCEEEFRSDQGCPEFYLRLVLSTEPPTMVVALNDPGLDRALEIHPPELMLAHGSRHYPEAKPASRAVAARKRHARHQSLLDERCSAGDRSRQEETISIGYHP